jgi:hypothetical protein
MTVALSSGGSLRGWRGRDARPDLDQLELQAGQRPVGQPERTTQFAHHQETTV